MSQELICAPESGTDAARMAADNFQSNLRALEGSQPALARLLQEAVLPPVSWVIGRDGSLTCREAAGRWWGGSSLPLRVGRSLMKTLDMRGAVGCFLAPGTAGQILAALDNSSVRQAIISVIPDTADALIALHCHDFSPQILDGRLWLACGDAWDEQLTKLLQSEPGLCVPQQFFRNGLISEDKLSALIAKANPIFSAETSRRSAAMEEIRARRTVKANGFRRVCVVAGSSFSLWDVAGPVLHETLCRQPGSWLRLDKDHPICASALALAMALEKCDALVTANVFRADLPGVAPDEMPWFTWVTQPRFAAPQAPATKDVLLLADPAWQAAAISAGWSADRLVSAGWPLIAQSSQIPKNGPLVLIGDAPLSPLPKGLDDFSSHIVLWEQIAQELSVDPLRLGFDMEHYLTARMKRLEIDQSVDRELFRRELIVPSWRRGIARLLAKAGLPLVVFGAGWGQGDEFTRHWGGPVHAMTELIKFSGLASALVHPSPQGEGHPIQGLGRPVLKPATHAAAMIRQAQAILAGQFRAPPGIAPLSAQGVFALLEKRA
jgi:hypothetical protein